jgi:hypothetical protein
MATTVLDLKEGEGVIEPDGVFEAEGTDGVLGVVITSKSNGC